MIDRRELIQRAAMLLGGAVSSSATLGVLSGCVSAPPAAAGAPPRFFTASEAAAVEIISEQILPRTNTPGAIDVGVPAFIDRMMADFYQEGEQTILRAGLARVEADARAAHGTGFVALASEQQIAQMQVYDREAYERTQLPVATPPAPAHFFRMLKELTTLGFFTSETGASQFLRYVSVPGPLQSDVPYSSIGRAWAT
ncbi:MAG: gluconate 2-dehydrogenase subunit 3 family protein [Alphaproteobacteria bacterium]|nr:gluconate 2-dehydrogenase subunit 3 family protein [Alphaproteobacteria bacterium]